MQSHLSASAIGHEALPSWKRALDISFCVVALPFLALAAFWAFLNAAITSPGPIFFRQERVGYKGRRFLLFKFRTMHVSANGSAHEAHFSELMRSDVPMQKLDSRGDARLIPGGWLLRASGFDELPQIINVLRGEMSIVGPRPCIPYEYEQYFAWQRDRLNSVPGLTGLWQVSGKNRTTFDQMVRLDIAYGERLSLNTDLWIMLRTVPALWTQISDIRKARADAKRLSPAAASNAVRNGASVSSTFASRSQNVIVDTAGERRHSTAPRRDSFSFTARRDAESVKRQVGRSNPQP
jgi:lipopolysaccharide/colanic/teichoic acid biosynthesis glycosyltransferase